MYKLYTRDMDPPLDQFSVASAARPLCTSHFEWNLRKVGTAVAYNEEQSFSNTLNR